MSELGDLTRARGGVATRAVEGLQTRARASSRAIGGVGFGEIVTEGGDCGIHVSVRTVFTNVRGVAVRRAGGGRYGILVLMRNCGNYGILHVFNRQHTVCVVVEDVAGVAVPIGDRAVLLAGGRLIGAVEDRVRMRGYLKYGGGADPLGVKDHDPELFALLCGGGGIAARGSIFDRDAVQIPLVFQLGNTRAVSGEIKKRKVNGKGHTQARRAAQLEIMRVVKQCRVGDVAVSGHSFVVCLTVAVFVPAADHASLVEALGRDGQIALLDGAKDLHAIGDHPGDGIGLLLHRLELLINRNVCDASDVFLCVAQDAFLPAKEGVALLLGCFGCVGGGVEGKSVLAHGNALEEYAVVIIPVHGEIGSQVFRYADLQREALQLLAVECDVNGVIARFQCVQFACGQCDAAQNVRAARYALGKEYLRILFQRDGYGFGGIGDHRDQNVACVYAVVGFLKFIRADRAFGSNGRGGLDAAVHRLHNLGEINCRGVVCKARTRLILAGKNALVALCIRYGLLAVYGIQADDAVLSREHAAIQDQLVVGDAVCDHRFIKRNLLDRSQLLFQRLGGGGVCTRASLGDRAAKYVKLRVFGVLVAVVANGDQDGILFTDHHLLDKRLEVHKGGIHRRGLGERSLRALCRDVTRNALCRDVKCKACALARIQRADAVGEICASRARIRDVEEELFCGVIDLIGVIEAQCLGIEVYALAGERGAACVAELHHELELSFDHFCVKGGDIAVCRFGIVNRDGIAPLAALVAEHPLDDRAGKRVLALLPRLGFHVQECVNTVFICKGNVAVT